MLCLALASGCNSCSDLDVCDPMASTASVGGIWTISGEGTRAGCANPIHNGDFELGPSENLFVERVSVPDDMGPMEPPPEGGPGDRGPGDRGPNDARPDVQRDDALRDAARDASYDAPAAVDIRVGDGPRADRLKADGKARDGAADRRRPDLRRPDLRRDSRRWPSYHYVLLLKSAPPGFSLTGQVQGSCVYFTTRETDLLGTVVYEMKGTAKSSGREIKGRFTGTGPAGCHASGTFGVEVH